MIIIGASTGGPGHLKHILGALGGVKLPPVVIAQHMDARLVGSFASHLGTETKRKTMLVNAETKIGEEGVYVCQQSSRFVMEGWSVSLVPVKETGHLYNPSIDLLFESACEVAKRRPVMGILLTGIGHDGAMGLARMFDAGARCIAESERSAIVYGMPKKAFEYNPRVTVLTLDEIVESIRKFGAEYVV